MSEVFALKYRPKKLADVIGQEAATRVLVNSIKSGDIHHAHIFAGHFGCGKTSTARIYAASLNNPKGISLEPDLNSPLVQSIFEGKHPDVREMDAAALGRIDDIRDVKENIQYSPIECRYKFVIIDEAHRLTGAAAEAALKMIEEPPPETIFILCTTDPQKLKETIDSRCMALWFNKVSWDQIYGHLKNVADQEKMNYDDLALKIAARRAKGSVRNSLQNLQMIMTYAGKEKITQEVALAALGAINESHYFDMVDAILKPDAGSAMRVLDQLLSGGRDVGEVLDGLVGHLRNLLVITTCSSTSGLLYLTDDEKKKFVHQIAALPAEGKAIMLISYMIDLLAEVNRGIAMNVHPQTLLENFAVKSIVYNAGLKKKE